MEVENEEKAEAKKESKDYSESMKKTSENIREEIEASYKNIKEMLKNLDNASNINEFMCIKKEIMREIVEMVPTRVGNCPFCIYNSVNCKYCEYGITHEYCEENSPYDKIINALGNLYFYIDDYY